MALTSEPVFAKPIVVVSKCLGFAACRWNGQCMPDKCVESMVPHVEFQPVCPECEVGLGIPRDPIRVVKPKGEECFYLRQPATGRDITEEMNSWVDTFLSGVTTVDGFLLKYRSPSCGMFNVPFYKSIEKGSAIGKGAGFFGRAVRQRFPFAAIEDEGRLHNFTIREHYLTRLFLLAAFRQAREAVLASNRLGPLVDFQARNKLLLMAFHQDAMRKAGRLIGEHKGQDLEEILKTYHDTLLQATRYPMRFTNAINTLEHGYGYFKNKVNAEEKEYFLNTLCEYRAARVPLSVPRHLLRSWAVRFEESYIIEQTFFEPYPKDLVAISDSGKGRDVK